VKFGFVQEHRETFRVGMMCRVLKVSRSGYYAWRHREPSRREVEDRRHAESIREVHRESRGIYGSPRVYQALQQTRTPCGKHRVARIMREEGLRGRAARRFRSVSTKRSTAPAAPNHLAGNFTASAPNAVWVGDLTQVRTREGWLFLAVLLDLFSRKIVGYATSARPQQEVALEALARAVAARRPEPGLLHHTDRGGQYLSAEYQDRLDRHGMICSMSAPGRCQDNAVAESFFHTLKAEWIYHFDFKTREQARLAIFDYVEGFYNRTRMHSTLGYRSPEQYEKLMSVA
jgi:transposase InsO family protein